MTTTRRTAGKRMLILAALLAVTACGAASEQGVNRSPGPVTPPGAATAGDTRTPSGAGPATAPKRLRVIGTNDFHGHLRSISPEWAGGRLVGGAAVLATHIQRARSAVDAPTVLLDGGDVMQGTLASNLTFGRSTVDYYNMVGYTAAAFGNHEFDWGADTLAARVRQAEFAWLGANVLVRGTDTLPSWSKPTLTITLPGCAAGPPACDSVVVGIIGIITQSTPSAALPSHVAAFEFEDEATVIDRWVPRLRNEADFVIVVAHEGAYCAGGSANGCNGPILEIASRLRHPPDLIVSGHSHTLFDVVRGGVKVVQSSSYGTRLSIVDLERVSSDRVVVQAVAQPVTYADEVEADPRVAALVHSYTEDIRHILDEVVATLPEPMLRSGREYALGNLIADAQRHATGADIALMNNGGIRTELPAGPVRYEDIFRVQPFGNTLVLLDLTGAQVLAAIEHSLIPGRSGAHFSGVRARFDPGAAEGNRLVEAALDGGEPIRREALYRVAVNNFLAEGGDGFNMLLEGRNRTDTGVVDLDALVTYLAALPQQLPIPRATRITPVDRLR